MFALRKKKYTFVIYCRYFVVFYVRQTWDGFLIFSNIYIYDSQMILNLLKKMRIGTSMVPYFMYYVGISYNRL